MRRRRPEAERDGYPPPLDVFNVADWWVINPDDPLEQAYARIRWSVARNAYRDGGDWKSHLKPPDWWQHKHS
ncbi:hypothetical protein ACFZBE_21545 [Streptomyces sp. NPDC008061]|uniref:hypothetical protein n=1 Tax=Streptomyces sp. NPDC008061 TaxID=3364805 RepID=UPI0036F13498